MPRPGPAPRADHRIDRPSVKSDAEILREVARWPSNWRTRFGGFEMVCGTQKAYERVRCEYTHGASPNRQACSKYRVNPDGTLRVAELLVLEVPMDFVDELVDELSDVAGETIDEEELEERWWRAIDRYEESELGDDPEIRFLTRNPIDRGAKIALAVGLGVMVGAGLWWLLGRREPPPKTNPWGQVLCPNTTYDGTIDIGDYVVIELQNKAKTVAEPTWAQVLSVGTTTLKVRIAGETGVGGLPKPLQTALHGYRIGDVVEIPRGCIYDRYRPGQQWFVLCGPALKDAGFTAISRAQSSVLGEGDRAAVVVRGVSGATESLWVTIGAVSAGQQVISGTVLSVPTGAHGVEQGDLVEFLRDCVVDAEFGG